MLPSKRKRPNVFSLNSDDDDDAEFFILFRPSPRLVCNSYTWPSLPQLLGLLASVHATTAAAAAASRAKTCFPLLRTVSFDFGSVQSGGQISGQSQIKTIHHFC